MCGFVEADVEAERENSKTFEACCHQKDIVGNLADAGSSRRLEIVKEAALFLYERLDCT